VKNDVDLVAKQYASWAYPPPVPDLAEHFRKGVYDASDPHFFRRRLWPKETENEDLDILVAGCGTYQAAFYAFTNPTSRVVGIDLSEPSLEHEKRLRERHGLENLALRQMDLLDVASLGRTFDLVVATGVLHHLPDPDAGLRALSSVLRPGGVASLMLYGLYNRAGVYTLKELFARLGLRQDRASLDVVKATLAALPPWHHARSYVGTAPDLASDAGLVDTFLHPIDRAYTVPQILELVRGADMAFQGWLDPGVYAVQEALVGTHPVSMRVKDLSEEERWVMVELVTQAISCHRFLACHTARKVSEYRPDFLADTALAYKPALTHGGAVDGQNVLQRAGRRAQLTPAEAGWMRRADGALSIGELLGVGAAKSARASALRFFGDLWERGHIVVEIP
jgi:SAM-dependent methyltransferase